MCNHISLFIIVFVVVHHCNKALQQLWQKLRWRKLHEELHALYSLPNITGVIK